MAGSAAAADSEFMPALRSASREAAPQPLLWSSGDDRSVALHLRRLEDAGQVWKVTPRVYAARGTLDSQDVRAHAISRELAEEGLRVEALQRLVIALQTAAWIHCAPGTATSLPTNVGRTGPTAFDVVVPSGSHRFASPHIHVHEYLLAPAMVQVLGIVAVTTADRTAADLARILDPEAAIAQLDALATRCGITPQSVTATLRAMPRQRGVATARRTVRLWRARRES